MILKKTYFFTICICMLVSCRTTQERVSGKYVDITYSDSLKLNKDGTYVYLEILKSGALGRTDGHWELKKNRVEFTNNKTAFIGYRLEVNRERSGEEGSLQFLLGNTGKPLTIKQVRISYKDQIINEVKSVQSENTVKIPDQYDFMVINTHHFANILIKDTLQANYNYNVKVFPLERLYELDKIPFVVRGKRLKGTQETQYDDRIIKFKKTRN